MCTCAKNDGYLRHFQLKGKRKCENQVNILITYHNLEPPLERSGYEPEDILFLIANIAG